MLDRAKLEAKRVVLPETDDPRIEAAKVRLEQDGIAEVLWIPDPANDSRFAEVAGHIHQRREHKGVDTEQARALARQPLYFAASLVSLGHADASVAGARHTTAEVIRAGLHCIGCAEGTNLVSSMFLLAREAEAISYADCGVVPDPDPDQLAVIAATTAKNHSLLTGSEPRIAFLSFSTKGSAEHPKVTKMQQALSIFRKRYPSYEADGELQFDAAYTVEVAMRKAPGSRIAGQANVFIFPDLDSGNIAYKITERLAGFEAFGPLIQGLAKPCLDLSRGCSSADIVSVAAIATLLAT